jgi:hypothetical protein
MTKFNRYANNYVSDMESNYEDIETPDQEHDDFKKSRREKFNDRKRDKRRYEDDDDDGWN